MLMGRLCSCGGSGGGGERGADEVVIVLHVKNLSTEVTALQVTSTLDGKPVKEPYELTQWFGDINLRLRNDEIGQGQLSVAITGLTAERCKLATVRYDVKVRSDKPNLDADVQLTPLSPMQCPVTVQKSGDGSVTSVPAGMNCGTSCTLYVPVGTKVTLTATNSSPFVSSFWDGCTAWNDTCEVTVMQAQKIGVQWGGEVRPVLIKVPKGSFMMGSPTTEVGRKTDETQHEVTLTTDFWMAESEVTQRQYQNLMGSNPSSTKGDDLPVVRVNWYEAAAYCNALSAKEKLPPCYQIDAVYQVGWAAGPKCAGYRLPTEAEWEYAAKSPAPAKFSGSDNIDQVAWYAVNSGNSTHAVKKKTANLRGLFDLSGNVWEWVWDWYLPSYESLPPADPIGPATGSNRVFRGGSYGKFADENRVAARDARYAPGSLDSEIGFRVVRSSQ